MRGYVQNASRQAYFVLQRQIPPGGKVQLEDAYKVVGKKSGLEETQVSEFVEFLRSDVLRRGAWSFFEEEGKPFAGKNKSKKTSKSTSEEVATNPDDTRISAKRTSQKAGKSARGGGKALRRDSDEAQGVTVTPAAIIEAPYDHARALIEKTKDRAVLKKALSLTKHFSGKEQHMRHLLQRLEQVY